MIIDDAEIKGNIEKEIADKEYNLKLKKKNGSKPKDAPAADKAEAIEIDDVWSIPSETEAVLPKATKAGKSKAGDDASEVAARAARKADRERQTAWKKEVAKAAKCFASLNSVHQSLVTTSGRCEKNMDLFTEEAIKDIKDALETITKSKNSAWVLVFFSPKKF